MKAVVLANPSSSGFTGAALRAVLTELGDAEPRWPASPEATRAEAARAAEEGATVVAMGGDGMAHHVTRGLQGTGAPLGLIPVGTTNVFARLLGVPSDPVKAAALVAHTEATTVRLGDARWVDESGERHGRPVLFSLGLGWDAEVVAAAEREPYRKATGGVRLYLRSTVVQLRKEVGRLPDLEVTADEPAISGPAIAFQAQFRSAYTFAGPARMRIGPEPTRGFTVATWRRMRGPAVLGLAAAATRASGMTGHPDVDVAEVDRVTVGPTHAVRLQIDGEPLGPVTRVDLGMDPAGLQVIAPAS